jgi:hypothetical protein
MTKYPINGGSGNKQSFSVLAIEHGKTFYGKDAMQKFDLIDEDDLKVLQKLMDALGKIFQQNIVPGMDPVKYSQLHVVALTQYAAIIGVDLNMKPENFLAMCNLAFRSAHQKAPKFS